MGELRLPSSLGNQPIGRGMLFQVHLSWYAFLSCPVVLNILYYLFSQSTNTSFMAKEVRVKLKGYDFMDQKDK
jgi:hypothetical protein